jgi:hypothetical protein
MTPAEYVDDIVVPTLVEFRNNPTSRRNAYLSCITTFHIKDHLAVAGGRDIENIMRSGGSLAFDVVRSICNGTKHVKTDTTHVIAFEAGTDTEMPSSGFGDGPFGSAPFGGTGGREITSGSKILDIYTACRETLIAFKAAFPIHLGKCDLTHI